MTIWLDAHLPPALASWMTGTFGIVTHPVRDLGLATAKDLEIYQAARAANAVVMTKDADFAELVKRWGVPPHVLWVTCGNTTNERLKQILTRHLPLAISRLQAGEPLMEISDVP